MKTNVVLKFSAFSNITYNNEYDTGRTREEWDALTESQRDAIIDEAVWSDIDCWDEDVKVDEADCE